MCDQGMINKNRIHVNELEPRLIKEDSGNKSEVCISIGFILLVVIDSSVLKPSAPYILSTFAAS